jgi:hypothetical protein
MSHFRIYLDESCHLEHDIIDVKGIGYIKVNSDHLKSLTARIKDIKKPYLR